MSRLVDLVEKTSIQLAEGVFHALGDRRKVVVVLNGADGCEETDLESYFRMVSFPEGTTSGDDFYVEVNPYAFAKVKDQKSATRIFLGMGYREAARLVRFEEHTERNHRHEDRNVEKIIRLLEDEQLVRQAKANGISDSADCLQALVDFERHPSKSTEGHEKHFGDFALSLHSTREGQVVSWQAEQALKTVPTNLVDLQEQGLIALGEAIHKCLLSEAPQAPIDDSEPGDAALTELEDNAKPQEVPSDMLTQLAGQIDEFARRLASFPTLNRYAIGELLESARFDYAQAEQALNAGDTQTFNLAVEFLSSTLDNMEALLSNRGDGSAAIKELAEADKSNEGSNERNDGPGVATVDVLSTPRSELDYALGDYIKKLWSLKKEEWVKFAKEITQGKNKEWREEVRDRLKSDLELLDQQRRTLREKGDLNAEAIAETAKQSMIINTLITSF